MKKTLFLILAVVVLLVVAIGVVAAKDNTPKGRPFNALWNAIRGISPSSCDCDFDCEDCWDEDRISDIEQDIADLQAENDELREAIEYLQDQLLSEEELACINSGGTVTTSSCCLATGDFPDTCLVGACGCAPGDSHEVEVCSCGSGKCFNGTECVDE
ncbi:hypothetical protein AMJ47_01320 [Parcubacteria bacterium DG_72]|nr:MAG: hypothetical protein AMJ47_01320 [Parcubacteria bacterium DG_72]